MRFLLLFVYAVPWSFLGLYGDFTWNVTWPYLIGLAVPVLLGWYLGRHGQVAFGLAGNLLSAVFSLVLTLFLRTDRYDMYFKPFGTIGLLLILWIISLLIQSLIWRHYRKDRFTFALIWCTALLLLLSPSLCQFLALI